jgi:hypothetical protein
VKEVSGIPAGGMDDANLDDAAADVIRVINQPKVVGRFDGGIWEVGRVRRDRIPVRRRKVVLVELDLVAEVPVVVPGQVQGQRRVGNRVVLAEIKLIRERHRAGAFGQHQVGVVGPIRVFKHARRHAASHHGKRVAQEPRHRAR